MTVTARAPHVNRYPLWGSRVLVALGVRMGMENIGAKASGSLSPVTNSSARPDKASSRRGRSRRSLHSGTDRGKETMFVQVGRLGATQNSGEPYVVPKSHLGALAGISNKSY